MADGKALPLFEMPLINDDVPLLFDGEGIPRFVIGEVGLV
jgi:hypothetical protein